MNIKSSREIIAEFVSRHNFSHIFSESGLPFRIGDSRLFFNSKEAADFLLAASLTGSKTIGFFDKLPTISFKRYLRGECILISCHLPDKIDIPTLFCRKISDIFEMPAAALRASADFKMPVSLVISENVLNNYTDDVKIANDFARVSPYLHPNTYKTIIDKDALKTSLSSVKDTFASLYGSNALEGSEISFNEEEKAFFPYLLPSILPDKSENIKGRSFSAPIEESSDIENMVNESYFLDISVSGVIEKNLSEPNDILCPGCPLANIILRVKDKDTIIFSDVSCQGVLKIFNINNCSLEAYLGLISEGLSVKTCFIGLASRYKQGYSKLLKKGSVIFINDCGLQKIDTCTYIKHPKKINVSRNSLFAYSCDNIIKYSKPKIRQKKCQCLKEGKSPECITKTKCPALYISDNTAIIDNDMCTGCLVCRNVCPHGAI